MLSHTNRLSTRSGFGPALLLALAFAGAAFAQPIPFQLLYTQGAITTAVANDSVLALAAPLGQAQTLQMRAIYRGTGVVTIAQPPSITGSSAFTVTLNQALPVTLNPDDTLFFSVRFSPLTAAADSARLAIPFAENPASTITPITLTLQGVTSAIVPSYTSADDNNVIQLTPGATIPFPETLVGQTSPLGLNFTNIGSLLGQVTRVSVTGSAFVLQNLPLFPASIPAGQTLPMRVAYRPTEAGNNTGSLLIEISGADPITISLQGTAIAPRLTYQLENPTGTLTAGGTLLLPNIEVGQSSVRVVRVANTGTAPVAINTISAVGEGFTISSSPVLPQTLAANSSLVFSVTFTPTRSGVQTGTLIVNSDVFNLNGSGLGALLSFSYVAGGNTVTLGLGNNSVIFSPVRITESAQVDLDIRNNGTTAAVIQNIGVGQANSAYSITNLPALPTTIAPNATLRINIRFEPTTVGFTTTTLVVDNNNLTLTGSGTAPPALPAYTLSGPSGTTAALTQPNVGLKLASAYPVAITGTLTLAPAANNLPSDPAVQFATGGRTVAFRIPANSTDAIFGTQGTQLGLQTGTVAGVMTLTPTFATQAGNVDLTPATPVSSQFSVAAVAPSLLSVQVVNATANGFTVQVTGFSTTRTLTGLNVQFATASGFKMPTSQFTIDTRAIAATWFQSTASQAFGGQFRVSIPFTFQLPAGQSVLAGITTATVTASNESGVSTALQAPVQ